MKYLVIADVYPKPYGCDYYIFGIFDDKGDALKYIIEHPIVECGYDWEYDCPELFGFFNDYKEDSDITKEQFASRYIYEYEGTHMPLHIGGYIE